MGFLGFYWVLLGFHGFYRVLLDFTGFYWIFFNDTTHYSYKNSLNFEIKLQFFFG